MKTVCIIQARLGSTRLPGKVLKTLGDNTVLGHVIQRVRRCGLIDEIIVATPDVAVATEALGNGAGYYIGSEHDVLDRYYRAAVIAKADFVVRVTADCPLIDPCVLSEVVWEFIRSRNDRKPADYMSNTIHRTNPRGLDCEIFTFAALERAWREALDGPEREHVTPYISEANGFKCIPIYGHEDNSRHRWTLDTEDDWKLFEAIEAEVGMNASTGDILKLLDSRPDIYALNAHVEQRC